MKQNLCVLFALLGAVVVYAGPQVVRRADRSAVRAAYQVVAPAKGKVAAHIPAAKATSASARKLAFLSLQEKTSVLKELNITKKTMSSSPATMNLTVLDHVQTMTGMNASLYYKNPDNVYSDFYGTGVASFGNSTTMYNGTGDDPTLHINLRTTIPGKQYLVESDMYGDEGDYYVYVHVDNAYSYQQIVQKAGRLIIFLPASTKTGETYIAIRGSIPDRGYWSFYGCKITEL